MTHRDGFPQFLWAGAFGKERVAWRCGASRAARDAARPWARKPWEAAVPVAWANRRGRREALPMSHIACGSPPARPLAQRFAHAISMGH